MTDDRKSSRGLTERNSVPGLGWIPERSRQAGTSCCRKGLWRRAGLATLVIGAFAGAMAAMAPWMAGQSRNEPSPRLLTAPAGTITVDYVEELQARIQLYGTKTPYRDAAGEGR